jgi:hypothetical protein
MEDALKCEIMTSLISMNYPAESVCYAKLNAQAALSISFQKRYQSTNAFHLPNQIKKILLIKPQISR